MSKLDALWAYQEAELRKAQLEASIRATPSRQKLNKLHKLLKQQQQSITQLSEDLDNRTQQYEKLIEQADKLADRLELENGELKTMEQDEECTAEEMTELRGDIEKLNREVASVMREAKTLLSQTEKAVEEYNGVRVTAGKAKKEYDALRVVCEKELEDSSGEITRSNDELARIAKRVDPALLERYNKVKQHYAAPVAKVINQKCGGCNMSLPMVVQKRIAAPDAVVECENCGRILYSVE